MSRRILLSAFFVCLFLSSIAYSQTTGSIQGVVKDEAGAPVPGVLVSISGPQMPLGRTATSRADGVFQFLNLIPGNYHLKAELQGMGSFAQEVVVSLAKVTEVWPVLRPTASAEVTVTAATPLVDTKSTDVSQVTKRDTIEKLPLARTFSGTFQLAPGVVDSGVADLQHQHRHQRRRRPPGQRLSVRRRQRDEPLLRRPLPGLRRARHPGGQHQPRAASRRSTGGPAGSSSTA